MPMDTITFGALPHVARQQFDLGMKVLTTLADQHVPDKEETRRITMPLDVASGLRTLAAEAAKGPHPPGKETPKVVSRLLNDLHRAISTGTTGVQVTMLGRHFLIVCYLAVVKTSQAKFHPDWENLMANITAAITEGWAQGTRI